MQYIPQKKHFKKLVTLYFWCEQKPIFVCSANKTKPIAVNMSKKNETFEKTSLMSVKRTSWPTVHWRLRHTSAIQKKLRIPKAKSTTNQFILSRKF